MTTATVEACRYNLAEVPEDVVKLSENNKGDVNVTKWSGTFPIPQIGTEVTITFNGLGSGRIESYFVEHGYCGVCVRLNNAPAWKIKQSKGTKHEGIALVFGREIEWR